MLAFGADLEGVTRWLRFGPVTLQPALILLPTLFTTLSPDRNGWRRAALLVPTLLIAFQPDAATLTAFAAAMVVMLRRNAPAPAIVAAVVAIILSAAAWVALRNPDPVAFVEGTANLAMHHGPFAIALHAGASLLMLIPFAML